jgi:hypothetical protein
MVQVVTNFQIAPLQQAYNAADQLRRFHILGCQKEKGLSIIVFTFITN